MSDGQHTPGRVAPRRVGSSAWRGPAGTWRLDLALGLAVTAVAAALRWPHLLTVPAFSDENEEVLLSLAVAQGQAWPLTNIDAYIGPLHVYLVATLLALVGGNLALPRLMVLGLGSATAGLTYLLGRQVGGRAVGLLAGGLLATTPVHLFISSHVAWQQSTGPFWTALLLVALRHAWPNRGGWLMVSGLLAGVVAQTHPLVALVLPGCLLAWCWPPRQPLTIWRAGLGALALALIPAAPLLWANLTGDLVGLRQAQQLPYGYALGAGPMAYLDNLGRLLLALPRALAGAFVEGLPIWLLLTPPVWLAAFLGLAGLLWGIWRAERLLTLPVLTTLALLPAGNSDYYLPVQGRYMAHILPPLAVLVAGALMATMAAGWCWWGARPATAGRRLGSGVLIGFTSLLTLLALVAPARAALDYQRQIEAAGLGNQVVLALVEAVRSFQQTAVVALDDRLSGQIMPNYTTLERSLRAALALEGIATETRASQPDALPPPAGRVRLLLMAPGPPPPPVAGWRWQPCLTFPERARVGLFTADLYRARADDDTTPSCADPAS